MPHNQLIVNHYRCYTCYIILDMLYYTKSMTHKVSSFMHISQVLSCRTSLRL